MDLFAKISLAFEHGGFWMWPILALQLFSIAIIIERIYALYFKRKIDQHAMALQFEEDIRRGDLERLMQKTEKMADKNPVAMATCVGARAAHFMGGKDEIQGKMDEVLISANSFLDRRTGFLSVMGNVATLTGLLGTITGMIKSFAAVALASPAEKAPLLAAGISEAMNATAYGLIVAIPALLAYAVLQNRASLLSEDLNQGALKVFNWLSFSFEPIAFPKQSYREKSMGKAPEQIL
jgi:biopolymer transport protein ExbB